jgi:hypothetical protein
MNNLVNGENPSNGSQQAFDCHLIAIDVEKTTNDLRCPNRVDSLHDELGKAILIQVKDEVTDKVKPIADNDERKLMRKLSLLEKVLHFLRIVVVTLSTDPFDFPNLASTSSGLNVLEVNFGILTQIDNRSE